MGQFGEKLNHILVPSQRYQESRHLSQSPEVPKNIIGFNNHAKRVTGPNYLVVDIPLAYKVSAPGASL